ncbi:T9SS type A sorting domain-containing protein [Aureispira anguillae]|uniref:T9SS type A sorting domain-containing protein n=1 Tax=Aureispira anguillae TaxID=2864201 RepID=A0A915YH89_9BACT|nr:T9SS type A sorting domain-containing protein [Aureispira anguillae]BDS12903.1 T9SS type A sorting domain-containing protein [Aureispira anguillae]
MNYKKILTIAPSYWGCIRLCFLFTSCFFFLGTGTIQATHISGGEFSYECLGNDQYRIKLSLYRDCSGVGMPTQETININSANCGASLGNVTLSLDTMYEVFAPQTCACPGWATTCSGGMLPGTEVYIYCGIVTLPQTCTDWMVSWSSCCRNSSISNLTSTGNMYIEAMINNTICNSSPVFTISPIAYLEAGECYNYSYGVLDPEGDSLHYALTCPLQGANNCISNIAGLSPTQPFYTNPANSLGFDQSTGQMTFCLDSSQSQFAITAITVYQILNGDTIGYVQRDAAFIVYNNAIANAPVAVATSPNAVSGGTYNVANNSFEVCAGQALSFEIIAYDPEGNPVLIDSSNTNLDRMVGAGNWSIVLDTAGGYRPDSVRALIQINTSTAQVGSNVITITLTDNAAPFKGAQLLNYGLNVMGIKSFIDKREIDTITDCSAPAAAIVDTYCPGGALSIPLNSKAVSSNGMGTYSWGQVSGVAVTFSDSTIANPIVHIPTTTQNGDSIVLEVTYTSGTCVVTDEVVIYFENLPLGLILNSSSVVLCPNGQQDSVLLSTDFANGNALGGSYTWTATPANYLTSLTNTNSATSLAILSGNPNDSVTYQVNYANGLCVDSADITLYWRPGFLQLTTSADTVCSGDTIPLMAVLTDTLFSIDSMGCNNYQVDSILFAPVVGTGTNVSLGDDAFSANLPIGFDFDFYCNTYNQFRISSNGFITFDLAGTSASSTGCCAGQVLPDASIPNNLIALAWEDLNPSNGGAIDYFTVGTSPNRQLVINFTNVSRFGGANAVTAQIVLHESTNLIDIYTISVLPDGATTQGIENIDGTMGLAVPGRNGSVWSATNDAYRFTPNNTASFGPITYNWMPSNSLNNSSIYNPNANPFGTTNYKVVVDEGGCVRTDSIEITVLSDLSAPIMNCGLATTPTSAVLFEWGQVMGATAWEYSLDSGVTWTTVPLQDSSLLVNGLLQGTCYQILVRALGGSGICPNNMIAALSCCTNTLNAVITQNGTTLTAQEAGPNIIYQWIDCGNGNSFIMGATGQSFTPTANGNYAVMISDGINSITSTCTNVNVIAINQLKEELGLTCYPNPTNGWLYIEKAFVEAIEVKILDNMGRTLLTTNTTQKKMGIDLSEYPVGVYFVTIGNAQKYITQKVIKQ